MKQRNIRKKRALDEQEELSDEEAAGAEGQPRLTAEDIKLLQRQRQRRTVGHDNSTLFGTHSTHRNQARFGWLQLSGRNSGPCLSSFLIVAGGRHRLSDGSRQAIRGEEGVRGGAGSCARCAAGGVQARAAAACRGG